MKGREDVDDALARTGVARGQRCALPTVAAFAHITTARYHYELRTGRGRSEAARVGQIYFGDHAGKWVRFRSALTLGQSHELLRVRLMEKKLRFISQIESSLSRELDTRLVLLGAGWNQARFEDQAAWSGGKSLKGSDREHSSSPA